MTLNLCFETTLLKNVPFRLHSIYASWPQRTYYYTIYLLKMSILENCKKERTHTQDTFPSTFRWEYIDKGSKMLDDQATIFNAISSSTYYCKVMFFNSGSLLQCMHIRFHSSLTFLKRKGKTRWTLATNRAYAHIMLDRQRFAMEEEFFFLLYHTCYFGHNTCMVRYGTRMFSNEKMGVFICVFCCRCQPHHIHRVLITMRMSSSYSILRYFYRVTNV